MKLGSAPPVFSRASSLSEGLDSRFSFESLEEKRFYRKTAKEAVASPFRCSTEEHGAGGSPESLNDDSAKEDEEGRETRDRRGIISA